MLVLIIERWCWEMVKSLRFLCAQCAQLEGRGVASEITLLPYTGRRQTAIFLDLGILLRSCGAKSSFVSGAGSLKTAWAVHGQDFKVRLVFFSGKGAIPVSYHDIHVPTLVLLDVDVFQRCCGWVVFEYYKSHGPSMGLHFIGVRKAASGPSTNNWYLNP